MIEINVKFDNEMEAKAFIRLLDIQEAMLDDYEQGFIGIDAGNLTSLLNDIKYQIKDRIESND